MAKFSPVIPFAVIFHLIFLAAHCQDIIGCGGFVKSEVEINFSLIEIKLYTKQGSLKYQTDCAPNNGYYMIPVYDKGDYILKVEPPPGWTFEPQSVDLQIDGKTDTCSKGEDINFQFTGFGVVGKVVSKGQNVGPAGVKLSLRKPNSDDIIKQTVTQATGSFTFEKVLPGEYTVEGSHPKWQFEKTSAVVKVGRETGSAGQEITVHGYDVTGEVLSDGQPIKDVNFVLFSDTVKQQDVKGCEKSKLKGFPTKEKSPLCYVTSGENGKFTLASLPVGEYSMVPFYKGDHITFDVMPTIMSFAVGHDSVVLKDKFQVTGFSVSGNVVASKGGAGVPAARVYLNGKLVATTKADGSYLLDSMKAGTYMLKVDAENILFEDTEVAITPQTPQLPDLVAARFSVCGQVIIDKLPTGLERVTNLRKIKVTTDKGAAVTDVITKDKGNFCVNLKPGRYMFKVILSEQESKAGLRLSPGEKEVTVDDAPVSRVSFSQFRASVTGKLSCLEMCGSVQLSLAATGRVEERHMVQATVNGKEASFTFTDIMPGKYRVSILHEAWCWQEKAQDVEVIDKDVSAVTFKHTGYILSCSLSHDITLNFEQEGKPGNVGSFDLTKGVNKFCLSEPGVYKLTPKSCHQFEQEQYKYDTAKPSVLSLTAVSHLVEGTIATAEVHMDVIATIKSSVNKDKPTNIGPLKVDRQKDKHADYIYRFNYWAKTGEKLEISASSGVLLFYPSSISNTVAGDTCPGIVAQLMGRKGVFIEGSIQPALAGVKITITGKDTDDIVLETNEKGTYRVGPLHADREYSVVAEKEGYVMTAVEKKHGNFKAFKLGEILVAVSDENSLPLPGVLLSLSGGPTNYRSNPLSDDKGNMQYKSLSPGQYFLRPMMKEYKFEPSSQMIEVLEGTTVQLTIKGTRVAFSCYGSITSLNGEPEQGVFVEAVGQGTEGCKLQQEESKTEPDGGFRIRGLQPNCEYDIKMKTGDVNQHIERTAPKVRNVNVVDQDVKNVNIIAFRRMNQMDLSGNVVTDSQFLSSLKILLYRDSLPDSPIHTVRLEATSFFHLPSLTIDNQKYILRLESSLSRATYTYSTSELTFLANSTYRHFTFDFKPKHRSLEQELSQSSFMIIPITLLVIFLSYNSKQILPFLSQTLANVQTLVQGSGTRSSGSRSPSRGATPPPADSRSRGMDISPELLMPMPKPKVRKT